MARIEDLLTKIDDPALRADLEREVAVLKEHVDFGLVFERHIPETVDLLYVEPAVGDLVRLRRQDDDALCRVFELSGASATLTPLEWRDFRGRPRRPARCEAVRRARLSGAHAARVRLP